MNKSNPSPRNIGGWIIVLIAGGVLGALIVLLLLQDRLLSAFWSFTGQ